LAVRLKNDINQKITGQLKKTLRPYGLGDALSIGGNGEISLVIYQEGYPGQEKSPAPLNRAFLTINLNPRHEGKEFQRSSNLERL